MTPLINTVTTYFFRPGEMAKRARTFYESRNEYIQSYQENELGLTEYYDINARFFQLNKQDDGETYLNNLRDIVPFHRWYQGINWTDLCFYSRPAVYHVIVSQKLDLIISLFTALEGRDCLNRSYPRTSRNREVPEYPIHTAVRSACISSLSKTQREESKKIVHALLELNANVNQVDALGRTPLHIAVVANNLTVTQLLIERDGLINIKNLKTPLTTSLTNRQLRVLFKTHKTVSKNREKLLLQLLQLPTVIITIAREYLF